MAKVISPAIANDKLRELEFNWSITSGKLHITFSTKDFSEAIWVIVEVGQAAEELNHHPDISLRNYNQLMFELYTHDADGITAKDFNLAERIEGVLTRIKN